jgi:Protein kinase domain
MSSSPPPSSFDERIWDGALREAFGTSLDEVDPARCESSILLARSRVRLAGSLEATETETIEEGLVGYRLGRYVVESELARGGVGVVYRGRDEDLGRPVAIKLLKRSLRAENELVRRFVEEAQVGAQLQHPGIVPVYDFGLDRHHRPWFAMPLVMGRTFDAILRSSQGRSRDRMRHLRILADVARAVGHAHERGVVHRDLKPHNVIVGEFGEVQVMDWGFAKILGANPENPDTSERVQTLRGEADASMSRFGSVYGTPHYMAPEQARGETDIVDRRSDVYALGSMLVEVLSGEPPHGLRMPAEEAMEIAQRGARSAARKRLEMLEYELDPLLVSLALRCLEADPASRPEDAGEVAMALEGWLEEVEARAAEARIEAAEARGRAAQEKRARRLTATLATLSAGIVLAISLFILQGYRERTAARRDVAVALGAARLHLEDSSWDEAARALSGPAFAHATEDQGRERAMLLDRARRGHSEAVLLTRLREARIAAISGLAPAKVQDAYVEAFRSCDCDPLKEGESAAARLPRGDETDVRIARGIDDWVMFRRRQDGDDKAATRRLITLARALDPDAERDAWRAAWRDDRHDPQGEKPPPLPTMTPTPFRAVANANASASADFRAALLLERGEDAAALGVLRAATLRFPEDLWLNLRLVSALEGDQATQEEAQRHVTAAFAQAPESDGVRRSLARLHARRGDADAVKRMFEVELAEGDPNVALLLEFSDAFFEHGDASRARALLDELRAQLPGDDRIARHRRPPPRPGPREGPRRGPRPGGRGGRPEVYDPQRHQSLEAIFTRNGELPGREMLELVMSRLSIHDLEGARAALDADRNQHPRPGLHRRAVIELRLCLEEGDYDRAAQIEIPRGPGRGEAFGPRALLEEAEWGRVRLAKLDAARDEGLKALGLTSEASDLRRWFHLLRRRGEDRLALDLVIAHQLLASDPHVLQAGDLRDVAAIARRQGGERGAAMAKKAEAAFLAREDRSPAEELLWQYDLRLK